MNTECDGWPIAFCIRGKMKWMPLNNRQLSRQNSPVSSSCCDCVTVCIKYSENIILRNWNRVGRRQLIYNNLTREICAGVVQFRKLFLQDGTCGRTGLHLAVESHNINMISFLLKNGASIDAVTFAGNTALHLASGHHMDQVVELLVGNGANAKIKNYEGDFALYPRVNELKITHSF